MLQLLGESVAGDHIGDWGMRSLLRVVGVRAEGVRDIGGRTKGEGGTRGADAAEVFRESHLQEQWLPALDGCEMGVNFPDLSEKLHVVLEDGVERTGERALRKSV